MTIAQRMHDIAPFHVMELMHRAKELELQGQDIVHMEVGEPDLPTPAPVLAAAQKYLEGGRLGYTSALGLPELRQAIAADYGNRHVVTIDPARVVVTVGASGALMLALGVLVDRDDEWLLPDPGYPCNSNFVRLLEGRVRRIPVSRDSQYQPTAETVAACWTEKTRGLLLASPANPTGGILNAQQLTALHTCVSSRGGTLIVDEIYHGLIYGDAPPTAAAIADDIFVINSFSKYFGMTGWRLGWLVVPTHYVREVEKLAQNLFISPPTLSQHAALAAFSKDNLVILEERRQQFQQRRNVLCSGLRKLGFEIGEVPAGAFYVYADISRFSNDSFAFTLKLLEEAGVAATPGLDFGNHEANRHMRFTYTTDEGRLQEGLRRIEKFLVNFKH